MEDAIRSTILGDGGGGSSSSNYLQPIIVQEQGYQVVRGLDHNTIDLRIYRHEEDGMPPKDLQDQLKYLDDIGDNVHVRGYLDVISLGNNTTVVVQPHMRSLLPGFVGIDTANERVSACAQRSYLSEDEGRVAFRQLLDNNEYLHDMGFFANRHSLEHLMINDAGRIVYDILGHIKQKLPSSDHDLDGDDDDGIGSDRLQSTNRGDDHHVFLLEEADLIPFASSPPQILYESSPQSFYNDDLASYNLWAAASILFSLLTGSSVCARSPPHAADIGLCTVVLHAVMLRRRMTATTTSISNNNSTSSSSDRHHDEIDDLLLFLLLDHSLSSNVVNNAHQEVVVLLHPRNASTLLEFIQTFSSPLVDLFVHTTIAWCFDPTTPTERWDSVRVRESEWMTSL